MKNSPQHSATGNQASKAQCFLENSRGLSVFLNTEELKQEYRDDVTRSRHITIEGMMRKALLELRFKKIQKTVSDFNH